jgi:hypothetical protein
MVPVGDGPATRGDVGNQPASSTFAIHPTGSISPLGLPNPPLRHLVPELGCQIEGACLQ